MPEHDLMLWALKICQSLGGIGVPVTQGARHDLNAWPMKAGRTYIDIGIFYKHVTKYLQTIYEHFLHVTQLQEDPGF